MITCFRPSILLVCLGSTLLLAASAAHADDNDTVKSRHQRHRQTATPTTAVTRKTTSQLPTRDDRHAQETSGKIVGGANGPEYRVRTGSMIPEHYNRRGYTTDAQDNQYIYDRNDIRLQRTNSVGDSLRSVPGVSVGGSR